MKKKKKSYSDQIQDYFSIADLRDTRTIQVYEDQFKTGTKITYVIFQGGKIEVIFTKFIKK